MRLAISRAAIDEILRSAAEHPEVEICGLLLGRGAVVEELRACANVAADPADSFEIDPAALIAAHREARGGGLAPIGHYHSHPRGPAEPSARDAAMAEPGSWWLIAGEGQVRGWRARADGGFDPVTLSAHLNR
jgi:desampylase